LKQFDRLGTEYDSDLIMMLVNVNLNVLVLVLTTVLVLIAQYLNMKPSYWYDPMLVNVNLNILILVLTTVLVLVAQYLNMKPSYSFWFSSLCSHHRSAPENALKKNTIECIEHIIEQLQYDKKKQVQCI
jgi:uncharacterized membrane protein required for colicin V production